MKYFTRSLYEQFQPNSGVPYEVASASWDAAMMAYRSEWDRIKSRLPQGMERLVESHCLHDATIQRADTSSSDEVVIEADSDPWYTTMTFRAVKIVERIGDIVGDMWLFHEVHLHPAAKFDFRVLLRKSEIRVIADAIALQVKTIVPDLSDDQYAKRIYLEECLSPLVGKTVTIEFSEVDQFSAETRERFVLEDASLILETGGFSAKPEKPLDPAIFGRLSNLSVGIDAENIVRIECAEGIVIYADDRVPSLTGDRIRWRHCFTSFRSET